MRPLRLVLLLTAAGTSAGAAQDRQDTGTLVVAVSREAASPVPTLWRNEQANREISDLLFLRLAELGPELGTTDESRFVPRLARRWTRSDTRTLTFELDPRARWEDGTPVTSADVAFSLARARDPRLSPQLAPLLRRIRSVTAPDPRRVVVRFTEAYAEQLYDVVYHAPPLPAHLLGGLPAESLGTAAFVSAPVGNGPYRFVRRVPGQLLELAARPNFFLGAPRLTRVLFLLAPDAEARANLLLSGDADASDNIYSLPNPARLEAQPSLRRYPIPGLGLSYLTVNLRDPADSGRPHPILGDRAVRRALELALDRPTIARSAYGPATQVPGAPVSAVLARSVDGAAPVARDTAAARRLLTSSGWRDRDGDGTLDHDGRPLALTLLVPGVVAARRLMAAQVQEQWRALGIRLEIEILEPTVQVERRTAGRFDLEFYGALQDPSPSGLIQSWTCAGIGGSNVGHYCDPAVDSLIARAIASPRQAPRLWRAALARMAEDVPAIFMTAAVPVFAVHRRYEHVLLRPESAWSHIWQWSVRPGAQLERDRQ